MKNFSNTVVITQPMYFPWVGMFEQLLLSDEVVFYDDVQFSKGSFTNRVQIKTQNGMKWLTVPLEKLRLGQKINKVEIQKNNNWRDSQFSFLENVYKEHKYKYDVLNLVNNVLKEENRLIADLSIRSMLEIMQYFQIERPIHKSSELNIGGSSSKRVLEIVKCLHGRVYVTGHGAKNYLDHDLFEANKIEVRYMDYKMSEYKQHFGTFTPYVSILDLIANEGQHGIEYINSTTINWKEF